MIFVADENRKNAGRPRAYARKHVGYRPDVDSYPRGLHDSRLRSWSPNGVQVLMPLPTPALIFKLHDPEWKSCVLWGMCGGQGRNRTADASLFRAPYRIGEMV